MPCDAINALYVKVAALFTSSSNTNAIWVFMVELNRLLNLQFIQKLLHLLVA